jgi:hypothetical protein
MPLLKNEEGIWMENVKSGFMSGFVATFVAASMMLMNNALHSIPEVHIARTLSGILGVPDKPLIGWIVLLVSGIFVVGGLFAVYARRLPMRSYLAKGLACGMVSWLLMMVVFMPLGGAGLFGLGSSAVVPLATLLLNLAYWVVLSLSYRWIAGHSMSDQVRA